jgi:4-amino-4-deoxy-L-arabinose transferase-like glycosyltransferase
MSRCVYLVQSLNRSRPFSHMGITLSHQRARPADSPQALRSWLVMAAAIACGALALFAGGLFTEFFEDEYAYISQTYYSDLFFAGRFHDPAWLEFPAYDLPPLPKYLIGLSLRLAHLPMPGPGAAWAWYNHYGHFGTPMTLWVARVPILLVGALGCVAIFGCGVLVKDRRVGTLAAMALMFNPLYRLLAHRAMSDVPSEAFTLAALAIFLWWWQRVWSGWSARVMVVLPCLAGICAGLALLSKFSGFLGLMIIASWSALTLIAPRVSLRRKLTVAGGASAAAAVALAVFVVLNPFMTARPGGPTLTREARVLAGQNIWQRFDYQARHRFQSSAKQQINFPKDALFTSLAKSEVVAVQGFGRFGLLGPTQSDSTVRFESRQDGGAILWAPLVLFGLATSIRLGVSQYRGGRPPAALALVVWALMAWGVVTVYLPMAWDRYLLPIQSANALLAAVGVVALGDRIASPLLAILRRPAMLVFLLLFGSYAFFWHSRDWNTASRLMLTYAMVDRGTIVITGLDQQTNDKAWFQGQYYSDKLPGFPLLAALPYGIARGVFRLPSHPLDRPAFRYWSADYWTTLGTSGVFTAVTGALLVAWGRELGCSTRRAVLIGTAYGLATPAYVYATLAYGHQTSALALFVAFYLLWKRKRSLDSIYVFLAGILAAYAAVIELQVGPVSAILGLYLLVQCARGDRRPDAISLFAVGALIPTLILATYNQLAFGSPWDMGYFHHATKQFADVHSKENRLGLRVPDHFWQMLLALLWGRHRGLTFYAPILLLAVPGWAVLIARKYWDLAAVTFSVVGAIVLVNVCYPEWTGGWSTGPRLLVPLLPFAMLPVAALLAGKSRGAMAATTTAMILTMIGGATMLLFQAVGARVPQDYSDPLIQTVWPIWGGQVPLPAWCIGERFTRTIASLIAPGWTERIPAKWHFVQFLPLILAQFAASAVVWKFASKEDECAIQASRNH